MELEVFAPSIPYLATVLVVGLFLWRVFVRMLAGMEARFNYLDKQVGDQVRQVSDQFKQVDTRFASLERPVRFLGQESGRLGGGRHGLARELSEFRGEMRGRLSMLVPQTAGEAS